MKYLCTADWHLREDKPVCRLEKNNQEWIDFQFSKVDEILKIAVDNNVDGILHAGDIFHRAKVSPEIVNRLIFLIISFQIPFYFISGNHDLLYHSENNLNKSSIGILYNLTLQKETFFHIWPVGYKNICLMHQLIFENERKRPKWSKVLIAEELMESIGSMVVITGDNHQSFTYEKENRILINPGCIMTQAVDENYDKWAYFLMTDYKVWEIDCVKLKSDKYLVTSVHIEEENERDKRIESFVSMLRKRKNITLDFKANLEKHIKDNSRNIDNDMQNIFYELEEKK